MVEGEPEAAPKKEQSGTAISKAIAEIKGLQAGLQPALLEQGYKEAVAAATGVEQAPPQPAE
eukprot:9530455-Alexandrium_andersonii.AAC.1